MVRVAPDLALSVEEHGRGAPLLLLHGFTGSARSWDPVIAAWAVRFRVLAVDLIGHGQSDAPSDPRRYGMEPAVADLTSVLAELGLERASVVGYSLGGRVALRLAVERPERISRLVLISASAGIADADERAARLARDEALAERIEREGVARFVDGWEREPLFASQRALPEPMRAALRATRLGHSAQGLANSLRGMGTGRMEPLWDRLSEVGAPALVVSGALDERYCEIGARLAAALPRGRQAVVAGAGHAPHLERPEALGRLVRDFLVSADVSDPSGIPAVEVTR